MNLSSSSAVLVRPCSRYTVLRLRSVEDTVGLEGGRGKEREGEGGGEGGGGGRRVDLCVVSQHTEKPLADMHNHDVLISTPTCPQELTCAIHLGHCMAPHDPSTHTERERQRERDRERERQRERERDREREREMKEGLLLSCRSGLLP